jgi:hypothetical protein
MTVPEFTVEFLNPETLTPHPENWRRHPERQRQALAQSLAEHGWLAAPILNRRTGHLLDGHARVEEAIRREEAVIPVRVVDVPRERERRILATFDPIGALAETDTAALGCLLADLRASEAGLPPGWEEGDLELPGGNGGGRGAVPPEEFPEYDEDVPCDYRCPRCAYEWSGKAR